MTIGVKIPETPGIPNILVCLEATDPDYLVETLKGLLSGESAALPVCRFRVLPTND